MRHWSKAVAVSFLAAGFVAVVRPVPRLAAEPLPRRRRAPQPIAT